MGKAAFLIPDLEHSLERVAVKASAPLRLQPPVLLSISAFIARKPPFGDLLG